MSPNEHIQLKSSSDRTDEAQDLDGGLGYEWFNLVLITISGMVLGSTVIEILNITYILPLSECELSWSMQDKGFLSVTAVLGIIGGSLVWGSLADIFGRRTILYPTLLLTFLFTSLSSLANSFWTLFAYRFFSGFFISAGAGVIVPYLGEFQSTKTRDFAILASSIILGIICVLLPILASLVINAKWTWNVPFTDIIFKPWRLFMFLSGLPNLITGISIYFLPESPKFLISMKRGGVSRRSGSYPNVEPSIWTQTTSLLSKKYIKLTVVICVIHFFVFAVGGMGSWFPEIVNNMATHIKENRTEALTLCDIFRKQATPAGQGNSNNNCAEKFELSTYSFVIFSESLFVLVMLTFSVVVRWIRKTMLLSLTFFVVSVCILLIIFVTNPEVSLYLFTSFVWARALVMILAAIIVEHYPTNMRSIATCIANIVARLSYFVASNYIAVLLENNCEITFIISALWTILGGILSCFIPKTE